MWHRSALAIVLVVLACTPVALTESIVSTCENPAGGGSESGACLLQSQLGKYDEVVSEDEEDQDEDETTDDNSDDSAESEDDNNEPGDAVPDTEAEASVLQTTAPDGTCLNWFGNNLDWKAIEATGKVVGVSSSANQKGPWGTMVSQSGINLCTWDTTVGLTVGSTKFPYRCSGVLKASNSANSCQSTVTGKDAGIRTDCLNGMCADISNVKHDWSQSKTGFTCHKTKPLLTPTYNLKSPNGKPWLKLWDPNCKVLCETIPECTGFSVKMSKAAPQCFFFAKATLDTASKTKGCRSHPKYATYFIKRK
jgi:hypothetical protein